MANAQTLDKEPAPLKKKNGPKEQAMIDMVFDPEKKYMFQLAMENPMREIPVYEIREGKSYPISNQQFTPFRNIVYTSMVIWNGERRMLRYYDGCASIFADEQPSDRETIDRAIKTTRKRSFDKGKFGTYGDDRQLILYLLIASWNGKSQFRTRTSSAVYIPLNVDDKVISESSKLDATEKALQYAKEATDTKMMIHASFLGIPVLDYDSGNELTPKQIRMEYRKEALRNAEKFIESYGNKAIEIKYYIDKALEKGWIHNTFNPNQASWQKSNSLICDISGIKSIPGIAEKLFEFSQLPDGEEFVIQLRALFD